MNSYHALHGEGVFSRPARRVRDPLQIPVELNDGEEHPFARVAAATRDIVLWLAVVVGAAVAVLFTGAAVPELNAAAPHPTLRETPAIVEPAPASEQVREWYLPDVLFNDQAATAEPIDTF